MNDYNLIKSLAKVSHTINTTGVKYDIHDYLIESIKTQIFKTQLNNNRHNFQELLIKINKFFKDKIDNTIDDLLRIEGEDGEEEEEVEKYEITMKKIVEVITDVDSVIYIKTLLNSSLDVKNIDFCIFLIDYYPELIINKSISYKKLYILYEFNISLLYKITIEQLIKYLLEIGIKIKDIPEEKNSLIVSIELPSIFNYNSMSTHEIETKGKQYLKAFGFEEDNFVFIKNENIYGKIKYYNSFSNKFFINKLLYDDKNDKLIEDQLYQRQLYQREIFFKDIHLMKEIDLKESMKKEFGEANNKLKEKNINYNDYVKINTNYGFILYVKLINFFKKENKEYIYEIRHLYIKESKLEIFSDIDKINFNDIQQKMTEAEVITALSAKATEAAAAATSIARPARRLQLAPVASSLFERSRLRSDSISSGEGEEE
jgi:hypothetical protein